MSTCFFYARLGADVSHVGYASASKADEAAKVALNQPHQAETRRRAGTCHLGKERLAAPLGLGVDCPRPVWPAKCAILATSGGQGKLPTVPGAGSMAVSPTAHPRSKLPRTTPLKRPTLSRIALPVDRPDGPPGFDRPAYQHLYRSVAAPPRAASYPGRPMCADSAQSLPLRPGRRTPVRMGPDRVLRYCAPHQAGRSRPCRQQRFPHGAWVLQARRLRPGFSGAGFPAPGVSRHGPPGPSAPAPRPKQEGRATLRPPAPWNATLRDMLPYTAWILGQASSIPANSSMRWKSLSWAASSRTAWGVVLRPRQKAAK